MPLAGVLRPALLAAARSPKAERAITRVPATKSLVDRFVAGTSTPDAVAATRDVLSTGRFVTIDHLGEDVTDAQQATANVEHYLDLLDALSAISDAAAVTRPTEISLKLSALGQSLPRDGHKVALENARTLCTAAEAAGAWVTVDAEDHTTTDSTLSIVAELREDFPSLGTVLQAYLKRTEADCAELSWSRIRLCKGAYREPASVAHQGAAVDEAYVRCLRVLMNGTGYPMVATHDPAMIAAATRLALAAGRTTRDFEFQMLHGIRDAEQRTLVADNHRLRVYLPYGDQWYGYFMRRLAERPANLAFFLRAVAGSAGR
ncbi:proline dehydrogenase family protein [Actinokineospora bangkokensis]|uniref:proline dehydrogenase n=1 Tax=Actinokineospora bangkokensis TaxID=1193682 RepID=A0A1Q9LNN2_9PSEU|nr:proline dehydrogenase family protein [Actinokineospora bangkokensis]OLR93628.1 proline dehydrogenase [Actinokineospora bangkokensis]